MTGVLAGAGRAVVWCFGFGAGGVTACVLVFFTTVFATVAEVEGAAWPPAEERPTRTPPAAAMATASPVRAAMRAALTLPLGRSSWGKANASDIAGSFCGRRAVPAQQ